MSAESIFVKLPAIGKAQADNISSVTLAFVGDAVYSLYVRHKLALEKPYRAGELQKMSSNLVSAHGQNALLNAVRPLLTEDEEAVFRRARNAKKPSHSKSAGIAEYNNSTGLEAVFGWLYLTGAYERLEYLLEAGDEN